jgi:hypothetical protein
MRSVGDPGCLEDIGVFFGLFVHIAHGGEVVDQPQIRPISQDIPVLPVNMAEGPLFHHPLLESKARTSVEVLVIQDAAILVALEEMSVNKQW